jgi:hypothetical protein
MRTAGLANGSAALGLLRAVVALSIDHLERFEDHDARGSASSQRGPVSQAYHSAHSRLFTTSQAR